jgi:outer membrane immunogenic protein
MRFFITIAILAVATSANAADMPVPVVPVPAAAYDWSGLYIGGIPGQGWAMTTLERITGSLAVQNTSGAGPIGGVEGGSRFQVGKFVFGADADIMFGNQKGHTEYITSTQSNVNRTATITAVGGAAHDNWLLYAKAGIAWAKPTYTDLGSYLTCAPGGFFGVICSSSPINGTGADPRIGWTVGAGIEWAFWQNWSIKLEYDYIDLITGEFAIHYPAPSFSISSVNDTTHIEQVKVGLRWKFLPNFW